MIVALAGGVGGAKLANGLTSLLDPQGLLIAVNTGDDFEHLGLHISPDLDSVMYRLSGLNDTKRGWGLANESWQFMAALKRLGGPDWFNLGDQDLATHIERTTRLKAGETLTEITAALCRALGINHRVVPMSDDPVRTFVETDDGLLPFQDYFVRLRCAPAISRCHFEGAAAAKPAPALMRALKDPALKAVIICPSNPYVSIAPILALPGIEDAIKNAKAPCIAVSPIIGGKAIKGPAAKMMEEMGVRASSLSIARHYGDLIDGLVIDHADQADIPAIEDTGCVARAADSLMTSDEGEAALAREVLNFASELQNSK